MGHSVQYKGVEISCGKLCFFRFRLRSLGNAVHICYHRSLDFGFFCSCSSDPNFCILDSAYEFIRREPPSLSQLIPLKVCDELIQLVICGPLVVSNLRASYGGRLYAHDAEGNGGCAFGHALVPDSTLSELWRFSGTKFGDHILGGDYADVFEKQPFMDPKALEHIDFPGRGKAAYWRNALQLKSTGARVPARMMPSPLVRGLLASLSIKGGLFLELFAGAAGLTEAMKQKGATCLGGVDVIQVESEDLTDVSFLELLTKVLLSGLIVLLHMGVECVTWSHAAAPRCRFRNNASPRITCEHRGQSAKRVARLERANWFLQFCDFAIRSVKKLGGFVSVENPGRSVLWHEQLIHDLIQEFDLELYLLHTCQYGQRT
jgi:hypothetical protein